MEKSSTLPNSIAPGCLCEKNLIKFLQKAKSVHTVQSAYVSIHHPNSVDSRHSGFTSILQKLHKLRRHKRRLRAMRLHLSALIGLPLILAQSTVELDVLNKDVLFGRHANSVVKVHIQYPSQEMLQSMDNLQQLCFTLNGRSCKCFSDFLIKEVTLPTECISDDHYWFAVTLSVPLVNGSAKFISYPISIPSREVFDGHQQNPDMGLISLVLPVTLDDLSRCAILLKSLSLIAVGEVAEMYIFVPDRQRSIMEAALSGFFDALSFNISIIAESALFYHKSKADSFPYAIQMAIKLLAAKRIKTEYYLTLDADMVLLQPLRVDNIIYFAEESNLINHGLDGNRKRALYDHEERFLFHPNWWSGSEELLNMRNEKSHLQGFGVTPSLLSTFGSLLTVASVEKAMTERIMSTDSSNCSNGALVSSSITADGTVEVSCIPPFLVDLEIALREKAESLWLESFGRENVIWSEYTLYRTVLDHYQVVLIMREMCLDASLLPH